MSNKALAVFTGPIAALLLSGAASAQTSGQDTFQQFLGAILGQVTSMDAQWQRGQRPLNAGRAQFEARLDADVRAGTISTSSAGRLRSAYSDLVALETQYGADGSFSAQERTELRSRYDALTQTYTEGGPAIGGGPTAAAGQAAFNARVDAALNARRLTRTQATRLRSDYAAVVQLETSYARGGISVQEQADLDQRLDALDQRVPDLPPPPSQLTVGQRLDQLPNEISAAQRAGILSADQAADLRAQVGDLERLEAAYARTRPAANDRNYLERRVGEVEARTRRYGR